MDYQHGLGHCLPLKSARSYHDPRRSAGDRDRLADAFGEAAKDGRIGPRTACNGNEQMVEAAEGMNPFVVGVLERRPPNEAVPAPDVSSPVGGGLVDGPDSVVSL